MLTLAFDTSTARGSVAVLDQDKVLDHCEWERDVSHGELLTPALVKTLERAGREMRDVDHLAIGHGPGSFTGVRIAVNAARAISYSLAKPVYVFDTTEALANGVSKAASFPVAVLLNAHKNLMFFSTFTLTDGRWSRTSPLGAFDLESLEKSIKGPHLCLGDGFDELSSSMSENLRANLLRDDTAVDFPSAEVIGKLAFAERSRRSPLVWKDVQALYIRASGAEEKLKENR